MQFLFIIEHLATLGKTDIRVFRLDLSCFTLNGQNEFSLCLPFLAHFLVHLPGVKGVCVRSYGKEMGGFVRNGDVEMESLYDASDCRKNTEEPGGEDDEFVEEDDDFENAYYSDDIDTGHDQYDDPYYFEEILGSYPNVLQHITRPWPIDEEYLDDRCCEIMYDVDDECALDDHDHPFWVDLAVVRKSIRGRRSRRRVQQAMDEMPDLLGEDITAFDLDFYSRHSFFSPPCEDWAEYLS